jgi:outer membrane protein OmpA-like peptidoglycan-associated protein
MAMRVIVTAAAVQIGSSSVAQTVSDEAASFDSVARAALPRAEVRILRSEVRTIVGLSSNVADATRGIAGEVVSLATVQRTLTAEGLTSRLVNGDLQVSLPGDVLFDFDKATIRSSAVPTLEKVKRAALATGMRPVVVEGHTDAVGTMRYNQTLSEARAAAVASWLTTSGIPPSRVTSRGYGSAQPVAPNKSASGNDNPDGRQLNRRVTVIL